MDRAAYHRRAAEPNLPTVEQRIAALEVSQKALIAAVKRWISHHGQDTLKWQETHGAAHEAMTDHIYALDAQIRRIE